VRVDSGVQSGSTIPGTFDSLLAKLIVTGATREQAIARARRALAEFRIEGVASVLPFHRAVLDHADFIGDGQGFKVHTRWIETDFATDLEAAVRPAPLGAVSLHRTAVEIDGRRVSLGLPAELLRGLQSAGAAAGGEATAAPAQASAQSVAAPIAGTIQSWNAEDGATVKQGELIATMEAMKMEMQVLAHRDGVLTHQAAAGKAVTAGAEIGRIE
jgi:acetyl-CoA/propionyl-CoA carboxylase biotin carboxyl carrier protein